MSEINGEKHAFTEEKMAMAMSVLVGGENFDELRNSGCYYVDKTELLYELGQYQRQRYYPGFRRARRL